MHNLVNFSHLHLINENEVINREEEMKEQKRPSIKDPRVLFLSYFGLGMSPYAPGTVGSLGTIPILFVFGLFPFARTLCIATFILLLAISLLLADKVQNVSVAIQLLL